MLDTLLDQEGLEVDPVDRLEKDIPLHKAVRFVNGLEKNEWEAGAGVVELLLDAGADPRSVLLVSFFALGGRQIWERLFGSPIGMWASWRRIERSSLELNFSPVRGKQDTQ